MVKEAERLKKEDESSMKRVEAKNKLESYIYNWRNQMDNKELTTKIGPANVELVTTCVKNAQTWLDANTTATTEEFEAKYKEVEDQLKSVVTQMYGASAAAPPTSTQASAEDVD
jgi:heat shock protein 1/8